jgi:phage protein D
MSSIAPAPAFRPRLALLTPLPDSRRPVIGAEIHLAEGRHAVATLTVLTPVAADRALLESVVPASMIYPDKTPVHFRYGSSAADLYDFYGYVSSHRKLTSSASARIAGIATVPVQYTLTGMSMVMQSARNASFPAATASGIARRIAAANQLAAYVTAHPRLFPAKTQAATSDFKFLAALAEQVGYRFWVDNALLYFVDPTLSLTPGGLGAPVLRRDLKPGVWDTLASFTPTIGETDPTGAYLTSHSAYTLRHDSGALASSTVTPTRLSGASVSTPSFTRIAQGALASSQGEADHVAQAAAAHARYWVHASASTDGNTALRPGRSVILAGDGLAGSDRGAWRITGAVHRISLDIVTNLRNTYTADLELGRDQEASLTLRAAPDPAPFPAPVVLVGGAWRAVAYGGGM